MYKRQVPQALFRSYLLVRARSAKRQVRKLTDEGRPDTVVEVCARSVQCVARGVRSKFFSAGVDKTISRVFFLRRYSYQVSSVFEMVVFFLLIMCISLNKARLANSGFPVQGQVWGMFGYRVGTLLAGGGTGLRW